MVVHDVHGFWVFGRLPIGCIHFGWYRPGDEHHHALLQRGLHKEPSLWGAGPVGGSTMGGQSAFSERPKDPKERRLHVSWSRHGLCDAPIIMVINPWGWYTVPMVRNPLLAIKHSLLEKPSFISIYSWFSGYKLPCIRDWQPQLFFWINHIQSNYIPSVYPINHHLWFVISH